ncbi:hypothetical protein VOLCADRAFT_107769 [Volvox carteri f. nagariensis]|uniref:Uncharacterized protein n=1 Tax=Volvox carteri f. nagariensis TaxID=3068 RepID=D8UGA0_VOLCA|nr:uncharacterized protein VOLCADRAFT_107769 [Volvox carteri f. nagariensis]EFJ41224.1 hypothetical protein VOLCADRAFT_107769 [Volvox carteri f. nagariensis]|eukprot:XP_002957675.1 hypothetical protein VOLCADRAFT_107769 [Volvox carteri f. nagariensis]
MPDIISGWASLLGPVAELPLYWLYFPPAPSVPLPLIQHAATGTTAAAIVHRVLNPSFVSQSFVPRHVASPIDRRPKLQVSAMGPEPYSGVDQSRRRVRKPEWVRLATDGVRNNHLLYGRILEEDADNDPEVARLLEGTEGDPDRIREKMKFALKETDMHRERQGSEVPPVLRFRAISPMGLWLYHNADDDQSFFEYDNDELAAGEARMASYIHDIGDVEYQDNWARVWIDMGTADELSLDVLINMLVGFSAEMCGLKSVLLGGENEDWPVPEEDREFGPDADYMKVGMDPMRLPEGLDEEFQFMDDEGMLEGGKGIRNRTSSSTSSTSGDGDAYGSSGYGIRAGPYSSRAEEQELQQLAERLKRRRPGGGEGGYYGGSAGAADLDLDLDFNPDELEFTDGDDGGDDDEEEGGSTAARGPQDRGGNRPWGASFVRRVRRGPGNRNPTISSLNGKRIGSRATAFIIAFRSPRLQGPDDTALIDIDTQERSKAKAREVLLF